MKIPIFLKEILRLIIRIFACAFIASLYVLEPFLKIRIGRIYSERLGHMAMNTDIFLRRKQINGKPKRTYYFFISGTPCNRQLLTMFKRYLTIIENNWIDKIYKVCLPIFKRTRFHHYLFMYSNEWYEFNNGKRSLFFTDEETQKGKELLKEMGIGEGDWYVTVFARDSAYLDKSQPGRDWSYHDYRNADIDTFLDACNYITGKGGFVVRMGSGVSKPFKTDNPKIMDYACSDKRSDFADVYLSANARFTLGTTSGISDLPVIFDVPRVATNFVPIGHVPFAQLCIYIPKIIRRKDNGQKVPFSFFLKDFKEREFLNGKRYQELDLILEDNLSEDVFDLTVEMMQRLDGSFRYTAEEQILINEYFNLFKPENWAYPVKTPVGIKFLKRYQEIFK